MSESNRDSDFEAMLARALGATQHDLHERAIEEVAPEEAIPAGHRSGFVAVVGQPNVGKSTLLNQLLGEKVAIVSPKPQTTRINQLGIYSQPDVQIVFVDTPGIHKPHDELGTFMVEVAKSALENTDLILFLVDASRPPNQADLFIVDYLNQLHDPSKVIHVMNKVDLAKDPAKFQAIFQAYEERLPKAERISISAKDGYKVPELMEIIKHRLPEGPRYYPIDQVSDVPLRGVAAEMIREQVLLRTFEEVPHSVAVEVTDFKRRENGVIFIKATIFTERNSQKAIVIGKKGAMLKEIASQARQEIEAFLESRIFLEVTVKILPNWRNDETALQRFGYRL